MTQFLIWFLTLSQIGLPFPGPGSPHSSATVTKSWIAQGSNSAANTLATGNVTVATGDFVVVICGVWSGTASTAHAISDTLGNTWTLLGDTLDNNSNFDSRSWEWTATIAAGGTDAFTCNPSASTGHIDVGAIGYTGATATDSGATNFQNINPATTGITHSVTTTTTDTLITYSFDAGNSSATLTTPTGFTAQITGTGSSNNGFIVWDKSAVVAGAQSVNNIAASGTNPLHSGLSGIHP